MSKQLSGLVAATFVFVFGSTVSFADDLLEVLEEHPEKLSISPTAPDSLAPLIPMAHQWDELVVRQFGLPNNVKADNYRVLLDRSRDDVEMELEAYKGSETVREFLASDEANERFAALHGMAAETGSPLAVVPSDQLMELWLISRTADDAEDLEEAIGRFRRDPRLEHCIWLITCNPFPPRPPATER